jgi:hypothetical protein
MIPARKSGYLPRAGQIRRSAPIIRPDILARMPDLPQWFFDCRQEYERFILMRLKVTQFLVNHSLEAKNLPYDFLASKHLGGSTRV